MVKPKKIKIVDITADDDNDENARSAFSVGRAVPAPFIQNDDVVTVERVSDDIKDETIDQPVVNVLKQIVKTTDLTECPNCHKLLTNKTLKYSHAKTCGIVKPSVAPIADIQNVIKPVSTIKPRTTVNKDVVAEKPRSLSPTKTTTFAEMRHNYYIHTKQQHTHKINSLFANAI
jgi:hypothetical protein